VGKNAHPYDSLIKLPQNDKFIKLNKLRGMVIGHITVKDIRKPIKGDEERSMCNIKNNYYCWLLIKPTLIEPVVAKGKLGLFSISL
jgi:hypothetical protein|tara:strand:- start:97 stop:354 length:258 start_codon:yes stop_codon:yes gene_type:complete